MKYAYTLEYTLLTTAIVLVVSGCSKETLNAPPPPKLDAGIFEPRREDCAELIRAFQVEKKALCSGAKDDLGAKTLAEAIWLAEADANYEKGDASLGDKGMTEETSTFYLPYTQDQVGLLWIATSDLVIAQQSLLAELGVDLGNDKAYFVNMELVSTANGMAEVEVKWLKILSGFIGFPSYTGCWLAYSADTYSNDDARDVMNVKLSVEHCYPAGTYFISISPLLIQTTNSIVGYDGVFYPIYAGTSEALGGPAWLHSGWNATNEICFPDYWDKHLAMRNFFAGNLMPDHEVFWGEYESWYSPTPGSPMDYGSPYYPMGPYYHGWGYRTGIRMMRDN